MASWGPFQACDSIIQSLIQRVTVFNVFQMELHLIHMFEKYSNQDSLKPEN